MAVEKVKAFFEDTGLKVIELPESSATVQLAAEALGTEPDEIAKTLSFLIDDQPILIVMAGLGRVDNHKYKETFHKKAAMIPPDKVEEYIGHAPGGVCPVKMTIAELEKYSGFEDWVDVTKALE